LRLFLLKNTKEVMFRNYDAAILIQQAADAFGKALIATTLGGQTSSCQAEWDFPFVVGCGIGGGRKISG
jgi:hypothetical protein